MTVLKNFPNLETDRLTLRNVGNEDIVLFISYSATIKYVNFYMMKNYLRLKMMR